MKETLINVPILTRVEGEARLHLEIRDQKIEQLQLNIYEPPRLFEKFLEGRDHQEVIDLVARICGICPVAYQMTASYALEQIYQINPGEWVRAMRRVFYCGEWIESHSIHIHLLAAPDFLGYNNAIDLAKDHPDIIHRGMRLQRLGNQIIELLGARSVHPVGACVGGFFHAPSYQAVNELLPQLHEGLKEALALISWTESLIKNDNSHEFISVSLQHQHEYPMNEGQIISDRGLHISIADFDQYFKEFQVPHSTALHCLLNHENYLVGPLARVNLNFHQLPKIIQEKTSIKFPSKNMFHSMIARAMEIAFAFHEAIRILENYQMPKKSKIDFSIKAGIGFGCTEAPRGLLWQRYEMDHNGLVKSARIIPPTSQNQARIEADLNLSLNQFGLNQSDEALQCYSEMIIRNYDPCISCSTHFLDLRIKRR